MTPTRAFSFRALPLFFVLVISPAATADLSVYTQDFETLDADDALALGFDDDWLVFGNVWQGAAYSEPTPFFDYGPFPAPNFPADSDAAFSGIVTDQGGPEQGAQQLQVFSDYLCCDNPLALVHNGPGGTLEANVYQEQVIGAVDVGSTWTFSFQLKQSPFFPVGGSTTAAAFIKTVDTNSNNALSNFIQVDTSSPPVTWSGNSVSITIDLSLVGHLLQFGFLTTATDAEPSTVIYDNVEFLRSMEPYVQDFELLVVNDPGALALDGWQVYGNVWEGAAYSTPAPYFSYGPFIAPNFPATVRPAFSGIVTDQGGPPQGLQQLQIFSDYECCSDPLAPVHLSPGGTLEANVYQERVITSADVGSFWTFRFDLKQSPFFPVGGATTAAAFIKTVDPDDAFALSNFIQVDTSSPDVTWDTDELSIAIDSSLVGHLLQFGFLNTATDGDPSTVIYDNVSFTPQAMPICGNSLLDQNEMCDDGNSMDGDGCSAMCQIEDGFVCTPPAPPEPSGCAAIDSDGDGVADVMDNCTDVVNTIQLDSNGDGYGNACDADINNDCVVNAVDLGLFRLDFFGSGPDTDFNGDAVVNVLDLGILRSLFFAPPGPGATDICD